MNYTELVSSFWERRKHEKISSVEVDIYFYLLHCVFTLPTGNPHPVQNKKTCNFLGISEPTFIAAIRKLEQKKLILKIKKNDSNNATFYFIVNANEMLNKDFFKDFFMLSTDFIAWGGYLNILSTYLNILSTYLNILSTPLVFLASYRESKWCGSGGDSKVASNATLFNTTKLHYILGKYPLARIRGRKIGFFKRMMYSTIIYYPASVHSLQILHKDPLPPEQEMPSLTQKIPLAVETETHAEYTVIEEAEKSVESSSLSTSSRKRKPSVRKPTNNNSNKNSEMAIAVIEPNEEIVPVVEKEVELWYDVYDPSVKADPGSALSFALWFMKLLPEKMQQRVSRVAFDSWMKAYEQMIKIDKRKPGEIAKVCIFARQHRFWGTNFYSPKKLRTRDKTNSVLYFDFFLLLMEKEGYVTPSTQDADSRAAERRKKYGL